MVIMSDMIIYLKTIDLRIKLLISDVKCIMKSVYYND